MRGSLCSVWESFFKRVCFSVTYRTYASSQNDYYYYSLRICAYIRREEETLRDFEEAKKQSALKRARFLNCSLVVFVLFSSLSFVVVVVRISRSGVLLLLLLTYSISARSRGFYRANKNSILSVKKHVLNTHTRTCVREFSSGAFSRALDV